ncbi:hypothetical protein LAV_00183 [Sphingobium phage Lacusarx]|uniref:Uncharacterized protein n=1 Tax=Sphingobium phage Lacusarx TaxID=1980139 RepID=A0A1W6DXB6_9CAUD|nr:hypothetical protein FDH44_gp120 [Sphingobium phage Lacusarx]ARK07558.1 hypothetical protein LAV_00183 [Sphingobium phage Lacusarx]
MNIPNTSELDDLNKLADLLTEGTFYVDHDEAVRLVGELKKSITRLNYLSKYNYVVQHYLGIAKLHMTEEQRAKVAPYQKQMDILWCRRLMEVGYTDYTNLTTIFNIPIEIVEHCRKFSA